MTLECTRGLKDLSLRILGIWGSWISHVRDCPRQRSYLAQQIKPLARELGGEKTYCCDIAAGPVRAGNQAQLDWIGANREDSLGKIAVDDRQDFRTLLRNPCSERLAKL